jgi:16S rRNA (cytosine1402-N4)-methyltransferase
MPTGEKRDYPVHIPVLINQVLEFLHPKPGEIFIDCTIGTGGHTEAILERLAGQGAVYGIDADSRNLDLARKRLTHYNHVHFTRNNFENLEEIGREILAKEGKISGILFDLGLSSLHVEEAVRGFSFQREGPLDMRFDTRQNLTAAEIVNTYPLEKLIFIFQTYGEEKFSHRIARKIIESRRDKRFTTTSELADSISNIFSKGRKNFYFKRHPATRIFQALRIAANREVEVLEKGLAGAIKVLSQGGRIVVISYHSLEDRIVKNSFREWKKEGILKIFTKKPIIPSEEEVHQNPRSRSAKLRAAEKL